MLTIPDDWSAADFDYIVCGHPALFGTPWEYEPVGVYFEDDHLFIGMLDDGVCLVRFCPNGDPVLGELSVFPEFGAMRAHVLGLWPEVRRFVLEP